MKRLRGHVAIVTGASRGIGKGIALGLGEAGAVVYVTGRTVEPAVDDYPGTIFETAQAITDSGGVGIAVRCDHRNDDQVRGLFERVMNEQQRLDLLVNNATMFPIGGPPTDVPFWALDVDVWDQLQVVGVRSHYFASGLAAAVMIGQGRGLIVSTSSMGAVQYVFNVVYGMGKAAVEKMTADMAHELKPYGVAAIALRPAFTRTEALMAHAGKYDLSGAVSPRFNGRVVAMLAADAAAIQNTGLALDSTALAARYGVTDEDETVDLTEDMARSAV